MKIKNERFFYHTPEEKRKRFMISILVTLGVITILSPFIFGFVSDFIPFITYEFTTEEFDRVCGYTTSEYLKLSPKDRLGDTAPYFKDGRFLIKLTINENKELKKAAANYLANAKKNKNIKISDDLKTIELMVSENNATNEKQLKDLEYAINACNYSLLTKGVSPRNIKIKIKYVNGSTGAVISSYIYKEKIES